MAAPPNVSAQDHAAAAEAEERAEQHEMDVEEHEAWEYWGYLFQPDTTGTDRLKRLLIGIKDAINERYEPSDQPDLTPNQLAHFYHDMHGDYDQLFLDTPAESVAFIYKSLGCLHSLQPIHHTHATAFTDPTVPALKTEGWIMWQTIQILLGPEEHSGFIREAVGEWDLRDRDTGELFPKLLPRRCFPTHPDKHMVAWYEGVSERLKREAEDEERRKEIIVHEDPDLEPRRPHDRLPVRRAGDQDDDTESVDSRVPALAYFRDPLYRHVDGRPSIVRQNSKRPSLSPRPTMMDKGKAAATTAGHIFRNVGSPHLWDGRGASRSGSRDRDRDRRRRSNPDSHYRHYSGGEPPTSAGSYESRSREQSRNRRHRPVAQVDRPGAAPEGDDDEWDADGASPVFSPAAHEGERHHQHQRAPSAGREPALRHARSHDPTPSQKEGEDYFGKFDDRRRNSAYDVGASPHSSATGGGGGGGGGGGRNNVGPSFGPSQSPLFASHVARHPQPPPPQSHMQQPGPAPSVGPYQGRPPGRNTSTRRPQDRYPSPSPGPDRRYDNPRPRFDHPSAPYPDYSGPPPLGRGQYPPEQGSRPYSNAGNGRPLSGGRPDRYPSRDRDRERDRRGGRGSVSDVGGGGGYYSGGDDGGRRSRPKQTRFADTGVGGRRYPDESPWRRGS